MTEDGQTKQLDARRRYERAERAHEGNLGTHGGRRSTAQPAATMATANSDTAASQGASASGAIAAAGGTAANASAGAGAQPSAPASGGGGPAQLIVRPPLDVYKKLAIVRLPDDEVMYQNADGSWGKVGNLDETRITKKKKAEDGEENEDGDAKMSGDADVEKSAEDADGEEKKEEEVSYVYVIVLMMRNCI